MAWYDQYKNEKILIMKTDSSNKFWAAYLNDTTYTVYVRWGRIGTKGQSQTKKFDRLYTAASFISSKYDEKIREGYTGLYNNKPITQVVLDRLNLEASIIGTKNVCKQLSWCNIILKDNKIVHVKCISDSELLNPDINPGIIVSFSTNKTYDSKNEFNILLDFDKYYDMNNNYAEIPKTNQIHSLLSKFAEVICKTFI